MMIKIRQIIPKIITILMISVPLIRHRTQIFMMIKIGRIITKIITILTISVRFDQA
jgi:hypothetical protein